MSDEAENQGTTNESSSSSGGSGSIRDVIERAFLAGIGAAALTKDHIQELVDDLVRKGQITTEEGREVADRLLKRSREEAKGALKKADSSLQGVFRDMGLVARSEWEDLDFRLRQLEMRVELLEKAADAEQETE